MRIVLGGFVLVMLLVASAVKGHVDAAQKQHHAIYDEVSWYVG